MVRMTAETGARRVVPKAVLSYLDGRLLVRWEVLLAFTDTRIVYGEGDTLPAAEAAALAKLGECGKRQREGAAA